MTSETENETAEKQATEEEGPSAEQRSATRRLKIEVAEDSPLALVRSAGVLFSRQGPRIVEIKAGDAREDEWRACEYLKVRKLPD